MSALDLTRRRAERFAVLVDAPDGAAPSDPRTLELLDAVGALRGIALSAPEPRADFVTDLRARLMAEADTALVPTEDRLLLAHPRTARRPARLVAASIALVVAGGTAGVAVAAENSLPGQPLYTVKQGLEGAGRTLVLSRADRGRVELHQASNRLEEAQALTERGDSDEVAATIRRFTASAGAGADQLFTAYQADGDRADVTAVRRFAADAMTRLTALSSQSPDALRPQLVRAATLVSHLDQEAQVLCSTCGGADALDTPDGLSAAPVDLQLPPAAQIAAGQAQQVTGTQPRTAGGPAQSDAAPALPSVDPSSLPGASVAPTPVGKAGAGSTAVKNTLPKAVSSAVGSATHQAGSVVTGVVGTVGGVVGGTVGGLGGVVGGLGGTPTPTK